MVAISTALACVRTRPPELASTVVMIELPKVALLAHDSIPAGTIIGTLLGDSRGTSMRLALGSATVDLPDLSLSAHVDSTGGFKLVNVPPGTHRIRARGVGLRPTLGRIEVPTRHGTAVRITLEVVMVCLDYCPPQQPRPYGAIEVVP